MSFESSHRQVKYKRNTITTTIITHTNKMAFDNYNPGDIIRIQYEAGSNPGSTRLVIFRELTDLRYKGPGFKATDNTGKPKCFCIEDVSGHEFLAGENDPNYTDWYYKVLP